MSVLVTPQRLWVCPNCKVTDVTHEARPHTRFHTCSGLKGISAPLIEAGIKVKVSAVERQDYVSGDRIQTDSEGRPIMAVVTEREDGSNDVAVFAPAASGRAEEM